jgi:hypothetical protein
MFTNLEFESHFVPINPQIDLKPCGVCFETRPRTIKTDCGHVVCAQCHEALGKTAGPRSDGTCPICRAPFDEIACIGTETRVKWAMPCGNVFKWALDADHLQSCTRCTTEMLRSVSAELAAAQKHQKVLDAKLANSEDEVANLQSLVIDDDEADEADMMDQAQQIAYLTERINEQNNIITTLDERIKTQTRIINIERRQKKELIETYQKDWTDVYCSTASGTKSRPKRRLGEDGASEDAAVGNV